MANLEKLVDELSTLTVLEASELSKLLEEKWGVSAAAPVAVARRRRRRRRSGRSGGRTNRIHRRAHRRRRQEDQRDQGSPRGSSGPRPEGGQGPRRRRPAECEGEHLQAG